MDVKSELKSQIRGALAGATFPVGASAKLARSRERRGTMIHFPLTQEELAFLTGSHRVSVSRVMKGLADSGRVLRKGRYLVLSGVVR